jgi:hypothetical protein
MHNRTAGKWSIVIFAASSALIGCRSVDTRPAETAMARSPEPISQVVALWSEAVLRQDNVPVAQGVAGKVYLFAKGSDQPITSPGKFTIYAYDDTKAGTKKLDGDRVKPTYQWEIDESTLRDLVKKDAIGLSYSLWFPVGSPEPTPRRFTIIVTFTPDGGRPVMGESALVDLPAIDGPSKLSSTDNKVQKPHVVLAGNVATQ